MYEGGISYFVRTKNQPTNKRANRSCYAKTIWAGYTGRNRLGWPVSKPNSGAIIWLHNIKKVRCRSNNHLQIQLWGASSHPSTNKVIKCCQRPSNLCSALQRAKALQTLSLRDGWCFFRMNGRNTRIHQFKTFTESYTHTHLVHRMCVCVCWCVSRKCVCAHKQKWVNITVIHTQRQSLIHNCIYLLLLLLLPPLPPPFRFSSIYCKHISPPSTTIRRCLSFWPFLCAIRFYFKSDSQTQEKSSATPSQRIGANNNDN